MINPYIGTDVSNIACEIEMFCKNVAQCPEPLFEWFINEMPLRSLPRYAQIHTTVSDLFLIPSF